MRYLQNKFLTICVKMMYEKNGKYCDVEKEYLSMVWNKRLILSIQITYYFFFKTFTGLDPYVRPVVWD